MVTLLMTFFVLLYSFSSIDASKFKRLVASLQESFGGMLEGGPSLETGLLDGEAVPPSDVPVVSPELASTVAELNQFIADAGLQGDVVVVPVEEGVAVRILDKVLFDSGRADLRAGDRSVLDKLAGVFRKIDNAVVVEGHTDNLPIHTADFPSNWELSAARALNVVHYLTERCGLSAERFSAQAYGEFHPIEPNDSDAHRSANRRVELIIRYMNPQANME
jgi:chemotaxis protein MotB